MIISGLYALIQTSFSAFERIMILLDTPLSVMENPDAIPLDCHSGKIKLNNVTFSYGEDESMVLDDFDLLIHPKVYILRNLVL